MKRVGFANKLKEVTYDLFKWAGIKEPIHYENHREDRDLIIPDLGCTIVDLWCDVGEKMREIYGPIWIKNTLTHSDVDFLIVSDVRHPNEVKAIRELDGSLYKIVNDRVPHRVGKSIDDYLARNTLWDGIVLNNGTLKELYSSMKIMAENHAETF